MTDQDSWYDDFEQRSPSALDEVATHATAPAPNARFPPRDPWAMLLARLFESLPLVCPNCGTDMRTIAFITDSAPVEQILTDIGEPPRPPPITPAHGSPSWDDVPEPMPDCDLLVPIRPICHPG